MTDIKAQNKPFYWAANFLRSLFRSGVQHLIISPGSRSTPLTLAAAALPGFQKQVILDERSAAFTALGIGKATHQPAALICTSGTAVANYFPAVVEARKSSVPLLVLSADRPPRLHGTGANQTIEQHNIFGQYPVFFRDAGEPAMNEKDVENLRQLASQAVEGAIKEQGPVHLNFPFSKPLEPEREFLGTIAKEHKDFAQSSHTSDPNNQINKFRLDDKLLQHIQKAENPLVIIGQLAPGTDTDPIFHLADVLHAPILSEQNNGHFNGMQGFDGFLRDPKRAKELEPDLILRFGRQPASKSLLEAIKRWTPRRHIHFSDTEYQSNIAGTTTDQISWKGSSFHVEGLYNALGASSPREFHWKTNFAVPPHCIAGMPSARSDDLILSAAGLRRNMTGNAKTSANKYEHDSRWLQRWKEKEKNYFERSNHILGTQQTLTDGHIYHCLAPGIPNNWFTFFSNSFPARDRSMFGRWSGQKVYTNRGASGIDGITSTAMGVGISSHQAGILFTGDLAFLHDTNALLNKKALQRPLVVIVVNNRGGAIFRMLPTAQYKAHFNTYFETPQEADITALATSYGIHTQTITTIAELRQLDLKKVVTQSNSMLHVIECQTDPDASMQVRHKLWSQD